MRGDINITGVISDISIFEIPEIEMVMPYMERKAVIKSKKDNLIVTIKATADTLVDRFYEIPHKG